jgi:POLQ-like helicase
MKLENRSNVLLAITKSKAKMYEFGVNEEHHIALPIQPNKLLRLTIGILGEFTARATVFEEKLDIQKIADLKAQIVSVSQYFEALKDSRLEADYSNYLMLLGASSYYLADMPGSSSVLAKEMDYQFEKLTDSYIEGVLVWLLKGDIDKSYFHIKGSLFNKDLKEFVRCFRGFFKSQVSELLLKESIQKIKYLVYDIGSDRDLFFIDILCAIALKKVELSSLKCLPEYTGLDLSHWRGILNKDGFIREFWPAQRLLGEEGVLRGKSSVVQMPTSAGKTKSTELIIRSGFLSGRSKVAVIIAPFRALVREITLSFKNAFSGEDVLINELQDIPQISEVENNFLNLFFNEDKTPELPAIIVSTPEKLTYLLRHQPNLADKIDLLIFDEGHQFDTGSRGVTYELLLTSLKSKLKKEAQVVLISAVLPNAETIGDWLYGDRGTIVKGGDCLPTIRSNAFVSWLGNSGQLQYIDKDLAQDKNYFVPRIINQVNLGKRPREKNDRLFPLKGNANSVAGYLGMILSQQAPSAIFCGSKATVLNICSMLVDMISRGLDIGSPTTKSDTGELHKISELAKCHFGRDSVVAKAVSHGVLPHSSNIPNGLRVSTEWAIENKKASLVVCTSTLAQGVNLPIKYLIITSTFQAGEKISTRDFHNLIGRAGRSGFYTEGSIIFANSDIYDKRLNYYDKWRWEQALELLDPLNTEDCSSSLMNIATSFEPNPFGWNVEDVLNRPEDYLAACDKYSGDISELIFQIKNKLMIMKSVESYIISQLADKEVMTFESISILAKQTLAYHILSDVDERERFVRIFNIALSNIKSLSDERISYYRKCLLGIRELTKIEDWLDINIELMSVQHDIFGIFDMSWNLILDISTNKYFSTFSNLDIVKHATRMWLGESSYYDIYEYLTNENISYLAGSQKRKITLEHVIEFSDGALGYDLVLIYGALADICEGKYGSEVLVEKIHLLQSSMKVGISTNLGLWLYSKGYSDREVCKQLVNTLNLAGVSSDKFSYTVLQEYSKTVKENLERLPSYFKEL